MIITNFKPLANLHRNNNRPSVDKLFNAKQSKESKLQSILKEIDDTPKFKRHFVSQKLFPVIKRLQSEVKELDTKARELWNKIINEAELM